MQVNISGHHIELTTALKDYVNQKTERLARHFDQISNVDVVLSVEKQRQKVEANIHVSGKDLFANVEDSDMYAAIDKLVDKLDRQLIKHKEKTTDRRQGNAQ
ncbi:MAG: ribosome-associated translation inhibitor RaiA [Pseudomonadales bacterium]|jgi:putative sigma-54 modulation protein|nr:ribosome-associated translation inhibitor RaiA [Pseudomonadales bacterium]